MINIGETIAKLRHERGMTQENLAETLCVSPQTISKWENSVNLPDVQMLPLIADVFGVRVDVLFGRDEQPPAISSDRACDGAVEAVKRIVAGLSQSAWENREESWERYNSTMREDERMRSAILCGREVVYVRDAVGVLALRRPKGGWHTLLRSDSAIRTLNLLVNADFRRALAFVLEHGTRNFTLPFLCKKIGVEDAQALERCLIESGLFEVRELMVDEQPMSFYGLVDHREKLLALMAALTYCAEYADWAGVFCCCYSSLDTFD